MIERAIGLRRELGLWAATAIVVGTVIGSGIFLVPKDMILHVGSPAIVLAVWTAAGLLSMAGALSYAELAAALPEAGGEYVYLREAYGSLWGFLYGWTQFWVARGGSIATLATAFFLYMGNFFPSLEQVFYTLPLAIGPGGAPLAIRYGQLLAVAIIFLLAGVNYLGVRFGGSVQVAVTALKLALIAALIAVGLGAGKGNFEHFSRSIPAPGGPAGFFAAMVAALWAYDGWNNVSMVAAEIRRPQHYLPIALIAGTGMVMATYLLTNVAYFYVLPAEQVGASDRVAAEMMRAILGQWGAAVVSVAAMVSIFAALNGSLLSGARVPYAMARGGLFFACFARIHPRYGTPSVSILGLALWGSVLVFTGRYEDLFRYVIFASWILYGMTAAAVIVLRRRRPELPRPYRTPGYPLLPALFVAGAAAVIWSSLRNFPRESLLGLALILLGLPYYGWLRSRRGGPGRFRGVRGPEGHFVPKTEQNP
ncbi:MAG: amino acid permease [Bryobacterales bacterium]|nr:amino acid permease [Bryobacterales bacterium]